MASGGYRKPTNPAPVSGPGALSRRTDTQPKMQIPDAAYGEQAAMQSIQGGAPMLGGQQSGTPSPAAVPSSGGGGGEPLPVTGFGEPSQRPDEPVTQGAALGPGAGPGILGPQVDPTLQVDRQDAMRLSTHLRALQFMANQPGASDALTRYVRQIKTLVAGMAGI